MKEDSFMNKITKEIFVSSTQNYYKIKATRPVFLVYIIVILVIFLRTPKEPIIWGIFAVLSILLTLVVLIMGRKIKVEEVDLDNFYLVEDEVENFKKRISLGKNRSGHNYIYTFRDHGEYTIYTSPDELDAVRDAVILLGYKIDTADLAKVPSTYVELTSAEDVENMEKMLDKFNEDDDVTAVFTNWDN